MNVDWKDHRMQVLSGYHRASSKLNQTNFEAITNDEIFLSATQRPSVKAISGRLQCHRDERKQDLVILITLFYVKSIFHSVFMAQSKTIYQQVYNEFLLRMLLHSVHYERREICQNKSWFLHDDNVSPHKPLSIWKFLSKRNISVIEQVRSSPCKYFLSLKLKEII